jgi:hypothetical protein
MVRLPDSPRLRRRLLYAAAAAATLGVLAILAVVIGNAAGPKQAPLRPGAPQVYHRPKPVPATAAEKRAAEHTLDVFVRSAVIRRNLAASWPLASPTMREGTSHADWLAGDLPVVPYPAGDFRTASFTLTGSYKGVLDYDVLVVPKKPSGDHRVYSCELESLHGQWLVDFCYPRTTL